jgi:hypothetical protein
MVFPYAMSAQFAVAGSEGFPRVNAFTLAIPQIVLFRNNASWHVAKTTPPLAQISPRRPEMTRGSSGRCRDRGAAAEDRAAAARDRAPAAEDLRALAEDVSAEAGDKASGSEDLSRAAGKILGGSVPILVENESGVTS